jgi:Asp-tRNA(Asn)/Glu-tRNA(Gln) amidotransferase A subunit family amidase
MNARSSERELNRLSATDAAALLASRKLGAEDYARACLARVAEREDTVNAWAYIDHDQVLAQARALDSGAVRGPLHGIPVGIKDIIDTADMPTGYGSPIYKNNQPAWDAACVSAIRAAGGLVMGKTVTSELATSYRGKTANPHNPAHTPGGSSSGSAAAVADFMLPFGVGTQTGGSTIRPSSFCGVVGYKPSFGLIDRHGVKPVSESLDTVGLIARSVADVALLAAAVTGRPGLAKLSLPAPPRVGIWRTYEWDQAATETAAAVETATRCLAAGGASVREAAMPALFAELTVTHQEIQFFAMARALACEMRYHSDLLSASLRESIQQGMRCTPQTYDAKRMVAAECRTLIDRVFDEFDILLAPSAPGEAPKGLESTGTPVFNRGWTLLSLPCVTLPAFTGPHGLPVGVQVIGRYWRDAQALAYAHWAHRTIDQYRASVA